MIDRLSIATLLGVYPLVSALSSHSWHIDQPIRAILLLQNHNGLHYIA